MFRKKSTRLLLNRNVLAKLKCISVRNVQISVIGAAGEVGANLSLMLKQNHKITKLNLYDDDEKILGAAMELGHIPGGPHVTGFSGENGLHAAVQGSELVVMVQRVPRKPGNTREQMIAANAPALQRLCRAMADENPGAFLAITTNPLNSMVPFASALLYKYGSYNPFKVFGVTHIDAARSRTYAANALNVSCRNLFLPVIGGHSDDTVIPLFSNISPSEYTIDPCQADTLTRLVRKSGTEIVFQKQGCESAVLGVAWSINEFCNLMIDAISGGEVTVNSYTANPHFGTRFFSGPTVVGPYGILRACYEFTYSDYESFLVTSSVPIINRDVNLGEEYVKYIEFAMKPKY
uniref:Malate dehydrogenase, mitochondrial n=1 Tax=Heliothis virescens TaxID=7102 RepID=A0A2A4JYT0_HELVI